MISEIPALSAVLLAFSFLWLCLWTTRWRILGISGMCVAICLQPQIQRLPAVLVADRGQQVGVATAENTLVFSSKRSGRYAVERWLSKFGDGATFKQATARAGFSCDQYGCTIQVQKGYELALVRHPSILDEECARAAIVVVTFTFKGSCSSASKLVTRADLLKQGVHAFFLDRASAETGAPRPSFSVRERTARSAEGKRPWTVKPKRYRKNKPAPGSFRKKEKREPPSRPESAPAPPVQVRI